MTEVAYVSTPFDTSVKENGITRIRVEKLFGQFDYELLVHTGANSMPSRVLLLYGDNGSGKTTILKILFHLLSHEDDAGHKSAVSKVKFRVFEVHFADGVRISAERDDLREPEYVLSIRKGAKTLASRLYPITHPMSHSVMDAATRQEDIISFMKAKDEDEREHKRILAILESYRLGIIYVTDTREVLTSLKGYSNAGLIRRRRLMRAREPGEEGERDNQRLPLIRAVDQVSSWAAKQAFRRVSQGEEDVNSAYALIIKRIAFAPQYLKNTSATLGLIAHGLEEQSTRSQAFVRFGLVKSPKYEEIIQALESLPADSQQMAVAILEPYLASVKARLEALEPIRAQLAAFVDTINTFYNHKNIQLDVNRGLTIQTSEGEHLEPAMLSSGEGQLLFLFASTVIAKDESRLFMIDEPEISLNVTWQRQLVRSLLQLTRDTNIQFVMATHSIELLTRYDDLVADLKNTNE